MAASSFCERPTSARIRTTTPPTRAFHVSAIFWRSAFAIDLGSSASLWRSRSIDELATVEAMSACLPVTDGTEVRREPVRRVVDRHLDGRDGLNVRMRLGAFHSLRAPHNPEHRDESDAVFLCKGLPVASAVVRSNVCNARLVDFDQVLTVDQSSLASGI